MKPPVRAHAFDSLDVRASDDAPRPVADRLSSERINGPSRLERKYPAMARAIELLWGYPEMNEYFDKIWLADGSAELIDPEVMADLMLLARVHQDLLPTRPKTSMASIYGTAYVDHRADLRDVWDYAHRMR
jgi:hypothetical protein